MIKLSCPYCEAIHEVRKIKRTESIVFKGKNVSYEAVHYECNNCHEIFDSAQMMDGSYRNKRPWQGSRNLVSGVADGAGAAER